MIYLTITILAGALIVGWLADNYQARAAAERERDRRRLIRAIARIPKDDQ